MKVSRIEYPLKTSKKDKLVCKCDIENISDYVKSVRNLEFGGESPTYSKITSKFQCTRTAVVMIDGEPMCRIHGGLVALEYLLSDQTKG